MFFKKQDNINEQQSMPNEFSVGDPDVVGVAIHFTPHIIYVYVCKNESIDSTATGLTMIDSAGRYIEVAGNFITIEISSIDELPMLLNELALDKVSVPVIQRWIEKIC